MPETYRIRITPHALHDLTSIFDYISQDSPQNARKTIETLLNAIDSLELFPHRHGTPRTIINPKKKIRSMVVRPFLVRYRIDDAQQSVYILHIRHGSRKYP